MSHPHYIDIATKAELLALVQTVCNLEGEGVTEITDKAKLQNEVIYTLSFNAATSENEDVKQTAIDLINTLADTLGIVTGSNTEFYEKKSAGEHQFFTVPAINVRMAAMHKVRAAVKAAQSHNLPHVIFELALSESGYTAQSMREFVSSLKAAHISLGLENETIYAQADHYQFDPKKYAEDPDKEWNRVKDVTIKALEAGVYNIDIDASKFETADPQKTDRENQAENARLTAELFHVIREYEREHNLPCTVSIGGEVGEVGGENTKYPQVNAYLEMVDELSKEKGSGDAKGLSKVSINVGSAHGGVLGPDGQPLDTVPLNFQAHHDLFMKGKDPRNSGHVLSVQHGASTLPKKYFALFPAMHVGEIHLATGFQNVVWSVLEEKDAPLFATMKDRVKADFGDKISNYDTEAIWFMKERKRVTGFYKRELLLSPSIQDVEDALEQEFSTIFHSVYTLLQPVGDNVVEGDRED